MTVNHELMRKLYPEWYTEDSLLMIAIIFVVIALFLILPYIYIKIIEADIDKLKDIIKRRIFGNND